VVKGKFSYLAPEAADGVEVDRRADIFAVGILLYELLTGKRLFLGETDYQTVELVRQARVPPIAAQNPDVLPELERIVRKALARDVQSRFQSAGDLQDALAQYLFSQRLKVTSRDIETMVADCLREKRRTQPTVQAPNLIDKLISEEMGKFTSLEELENSGEGSLSPSPADEIAAAPLDPGLFVDPRGWANDFSGNPGTGNRNGQRRKDEISGLEELLEGGADPGKDKLNPPKPKAQNTSAKPPTPGAASNAADGPTKVTVRRRLTVAAMGVVLLLAGLAAYFLSDLLLPAK
jgi:serine/threonine-protein kinase